jgi:pilus assembly protein FimV
MAASSVDVETEIDRLYQLSLVEFVAARNALAARLKSGGDKENAARVQALARPNVAAWAANLTYWTARREFGALILSTRRLQSTQAEGSAGMALRQATKERREAQAAVMARAESLLAAAGHGASQDTLRRVSNTLEALAVEPALADGVRIHPGRLIRDLEPPGFEAVTQLAHDLSDAPRLTSGPTANTLAEAERASTTGLSPAADRANGPRAAAVEHARAELAAAERSLERAKREAHEAAGARSLAEKRAEGARDELDEVTRRFQRAKERAGLTAADATVAQEEAEGKAAARDRAQAARDAALRALRDLE